MRIAHICTRFSRLSETFIYDLVLGLEQARTENHVLTAARVNAAERPFARVSILPIPLWRQAAFAVQKRWLGVYRFPLPTRATREALREIRPDVILAHFGGAGAAIAPLARELGIPLVVVFHAFDLFTRQFRASTYAMLWESGAHAVAVSAHGRQRLLELGCPADRTRVIHCGVDAARFPAAGRPTAEGNALRLVTIGRLVEKKGFDDLLRAVAGVRHRVAGAVTLDIWGDGHLKRQLGVLAGRLGAREIATFRGPADAREVPALLARYDAFVLSSRTARDGDCEGIPITLLEAQAAGLPVVSTLHAGIAEALPPANREWLAREGNAEDLGRKLFSLAAGRERWREIGLRGREWVLTHFALSGEVEAHRRLFAEVTGLRAAPATQTDGVRLSRLGGADAVSLGSTGFGLAVLRATNAGLGLLLSVSLALVFGVSREVDALFVAMSVAVFLARDLSRVIRTAAVPCLVELDEGRGVPDFEASLHAVVLAMALGVTALVWGASPLVVRVMSPGFDRATAENAQRLLRVLAPSLLLFLLFGAAQARFHARRRFLLPELGESLWRALAIVALFVLGRRWGVEAYAAGLAVAALAQWGLLVAVAACNGFPVLPVRWVRIRWRALRPFWLGGVVVLCAVAQMQIEGVLDRAVTSFMAPGSIALFSYADRLAHMMPLLLSTSLLTPWLPEMARIHARVGDPRRLAKQGALFLAALGALLAAVIFWAARDLAEFLLLHGKFDAASAEVVVAAVRSFALGIPAIFCVQCLAGLYVVERDLKAMIRMGLVAVLAHAAGNLALRRWGVPGIALSGSATVWVVAVYLWLRVRSRERVWFAWARLAGGMAAVLILLYAVPWAALLPWAPLRVAAGAVAAWAAYTTIMWPAVRRMQAYEREATRADAEP